MGGMQDSGDFFDNYFYIVFSIQNAKLYTNFSKIFFQNLENKKMGIMPIRGAILVTLHLEKVEKGGNIR